MRHITSYRRSKVLGNPAGAAARIVLFTALAVFGPRPVAQAGLVSPALRGVIPTPAPTASHAFEREDATVAVATAVAPSAELSPLASSSPDVRMPSIPEERTASAVVATADVRPEPSLRAGKPVKLAAATSHRKHVSRRHATVRRHRASREVGTEASIGSPRFAAAR